MKSITFSALLALHFLLGWTLYDNKETSNTTETRELPLEDRLLKATAYEGAQFAIYALGGEAAVNGKIYNVAGYGYLNALGETEIVDTVNWKDYITIGQNGVTRYSFNGKNGIFLPIKIERK